MRALGAGKFDRAVSAAAVNDNNIVGKIERAKAARNRLFFVLGYHDQRETWHAISKPMLK
jgi:hypothetical protein